MKHADRKLASLLPLFLAASITLVSGPSGMTQPVESVPPNSTSAARLPQNVRATDTEGDEGRSIEVWGGIWLHRDGPDFVARGSCSVPATRLAGDSGMRARRTDCGTMPHSGCLLSSE